MMVMEDQGAPDLRRFYLGHAQVNHAARSPRRCLFGPADAQETRRFVEQEMRSIYERQKKKWNFDFEKEQPLPGRYQWEPVGSPLPEQSRTEAGFGREAADGPAAAPAAAAAASVVDAADAADTPPPASAPSRPAHQRQITDMLHTRKRTAESTRPASSDGAPPPSKRTASSSDDDAPTPL